MDKIKAIAEEVKNFHSERVELSEENTKMYLILPIFEYLGWNYRSFREVRAEFVSDVRSGGAEKVDFAIMKNNEPYIFVECKPLDTDLSKYIGQLERYYSATIGVRYGILTDGNKWLFFTDNDNVNLMDKKPFYTVCLEDFKDSDIEIFDIFKKDNFENISSDLKSFLLKDFMNTILKGENKDFLNWVSQKLKFKVKAEDIVDLFTFKNDESDIKNIVDRNTSIIIDNEKPKGFCFQGVEYKHKNYMLDIKVILEYYIDNDRKAYERIKSWKVNSGFILNYTGRKIDGIKLSSMGFCELKNGDSFYFALGTRNSKKKIIELLSVSTKGDLDFEFLFETLSDVKEEVKNYNIKYIVFGNEYGANNYVSILTEILNIFIDKDKDAYEKVKNWPLKVGFFLHNSDRDESAYLKPYHAKKFLKDGNYFISNASSDSIIKIVDELLAETTLSNNVITYLDGEE